MTDAEEGQTSDAAPGSDSYVTGIVTADATPSLPPDGDGWTPLAIPSVPHGLPGRLVVFEGCDGAGKTTLLTKLADLARARRRTVTRLRTPSQGLRDHPMWRAWQDESLGIPADQIDGFGLSVMALGDRLVQQTATVVPALAAGELVLADRYLLSSLVYESSPAHQHVLARLVRPDVAVHVDCDAATVLARLRSRQYEPAHSRDSALQPLQIERFRALAAVNGYDTVSTSNRTAEQTFDEVVALTGPAGILDGT